MNLHDYNHITQLAKELFKEERAIKRLDGWFLIKEIRRDTDETFKDLPTIEKAGEQLKIIAQKFPISISRNAVFAGTQRMLSQEAMLLSTRHLKWKVFQDIVTQLPFMMILSQTRSLQQSV